MALQGFNTWKPSQDSLYWYHRAMDVFKEYENYLPLTGRQVFYRLVGAYGYPKDEAAANKLYNILGRARRAGWLPFTHLRDGGGQKSIPQTYADEEAFWSKVRDDLKHFSRRRQAGQDVYVELFCEAPGMMPQLQRAAFPYSIPVYGTRGYTGLSVVSDAAVRALSRDVPTTVLQVGDLDPSGIGIYETLSADVETFVNQASAWINKHEKPENGDRLLTGLGLKQERLDELRERGGRPAIGFERIALTWEQVDEHDLPTAPPSHKDSRTKNWPYDFTAQAEALPPDLLQQIVRDSIEDQLDMNVYYAECDREEADRDAIQERLDA